MTKRGRGLRRAKKYDEVALEQQWRHSKAMQPTKMVSIDQLEQCLTLKLEINEVIQALQWMLLATKSATIAEAIQEIVRLGLTGPDWLAHAYQMAEHSSLGHINKVPMAALLLASGSSKCEIAKQIASQYGGGASFEAGTKAAARMLSQSLFAKLLEIPLAARRKQLGIARAKLGIPRGEKLTLAQATEVLRTVMEAHNKADERGTSKALGVPAARRRKQSRIEHAFGLADDQKRAPFQAVVALRTLIEAYVRKAAK